MEHQKNFVKFTLSRFKASNRHYSNYFTNSVFFKSSGFSLYSLIIAISPANSSKISLQNICTMTIDMDRTTMAISPAVSETTEYPTLDDIDSYNSSPDINDLSYFYDYIRNPSSTSITESRNYSELTIDNHLKLDMFLQYLFNKLWSFLFYLLIAVTLFIFGHSFYIYGIKMGYLLS